ncbi:MAG: hypothetical protein ACLQU3_15110 [Limisphaerales bacterium]
MSIKFNCPSCSRRIEVSSAFANQPVECPFCHSVHQTPAPVLSVWKRFADRRRLLAGQARLRDLALERERVQREEARVQREEAADLKREAARREVAEQTAEREAKLLCNLNYAELKIAVRESILDAEDKKPRVPPPDDVNKLTAAVRNGVLQALFWWSLGCAILFGILYALIHL